MSFFGSEDAKYSIYYNRYIKYVYIMIFYFIVNYFNIYLINLFLSHTRSLTLFQVDGWLNS